MKLKIHIHSKTDWGARYLFLWIDNKRWKYIDIHKDNSVKVIDLHKIKQDQG